VKGILAWVGRVYPRLPHLPCPRISQLSYSRVYAGIGGGTIDRGGWVPGYPMG